MGAACAVIIPESGPPWVPAGMSGYNSPMAEQLDGGAAPWNLDAGRWQTLIRRAQSGADVLEDGAYARTEAHPQTGVAELAFYATALNKPPGWTYPFLEDVPGSRSRGAAVGRAWHEPETGFVQFDVEIVAAAQALAADYESGASDLDFVTYEQAVEQAVRGTPGDRAWLEREFGRLVAVAGL